MRRAAMALLLLVGVVFVSPAAVADEDAAKFFTSRGQAALEEKDWKKAEEQFAKALAEWKNHAPAVLGLAEAALGRNDKRQAIGYLVTCLGMRSAVTNSKEGLAAIETAETLLKKLDRPRYEYGQLVDDYVARLMKLAEGAAETNKDLARRCAQRVLKVWPGHDGATAIMDDVGQAPAPTSTKRAAESVEMFNGKDLATFSTPNERVWTVKGGVLVGTPGDDAYQIRTKASATGDYTLTMEMRVVEDTGKHPFAALSFAYKGSYERHNLDVFKDSVNYEANRGADDKVEKFGRTEHYLIDGGLDRNRWNTYEVQVRKNRVKIAVNGKLVFTRSFPDDESLDGPAALLVQDCTAEFRKLALSK